jgi:hypothetical protein
MPSPAAKRLRDYVAPAAHLSPAELVLLQLRERALRSKPANSNAHAAKETRRHA